MNKKKDKTKLRKEMKKFAIRTLRGGENVQLQEIAILPEILRILLDSVGS